MNSSNMTCSSRPVDHAPGPPGLMTLLWIPLGEEVSDDPGRQAVSLPGDKQSLYLVLCRLKLRVFNQAPAGACLQPPLSLNALPTAEALACLLMVNRTLSEFPATYNRSLYSCCCCF